MNTTDIAAHLADRILLRWTEITPDTGSSVVAGALRNNSGVDARITVSTPDTDVTAIEVEPLTPLGWTAAFNFPNRLMNSEDLSKIASGILDLPLVNQ